MRLGWLLYYSTILKALHLLYTDGSGLVVVIFDNFESLWCQLIGQFMLLFCISQYTFLQIDIRITQET
jgi:hypothetical protein